MRFHLKYFFLTLLLFTSEVLIATVWKEIVFLRSYFGDVLVVILIYTFILTFFELNKTKLIIGVFIFSCIIELLQYFKIADLLGLKEGSIAQTVVGNSFSWVDILCYGIGCLSLFFIEKSKKRTEII